MNRNLLIELFRDGMRYPTGKHQLKISKVFEITVRPDEVVELDEYEGISTDGDLRPHKRRPATEGSSREMFHVGRSVIHLKDGKVVEESGEGWQLP